MAAAYGRDLGAGSIDGGPTSTNITVTGNVSVGEKIVVASCILADVSMTVTDSGGNDYTENTYRRADATFGIGLAWADCATALTSGVSTITITVGSATTALAFAAALTGCATGAPTASGATQAETASWDTTDTSTSDGAVLFGCVTVRDASVVTNTAVRGTERSDTHVSVINLAALSNDIATGSATSDIAGTLSPTPSSFGWLAAHYKWEATSAATTVFQARPAVIRTVA